MRVLAWWGTNRATSSTVTPAWASARSADSTMIRTARRNTSGPSISMVPPRSASRMWRSEPSEPRSQPSSRPGPSPRSSTTAPAPSPKRMAVPRSSQSTMRRHRLGADRAARARMPGAQEAVGGDQAVDEARAGGVEVEGAAVRRRARAARPTAVAGIAWSGVQVAQQHEVDVGAGRRRPRSSAWLRRPRWPGRWWCRRCAARGCRCARRSTRRWCRGVASRSALVTTFSGRAAPQPVMRALDGPRRPSCSSGVVGLGARRHAVRSHATGWLRVSRSPATARRPMTTPRNGERTAWPATWPTTRPRSMCSPSASVGRARRRRRRG